MTWTPGELKGPFSFKAIQLSKFMIQDFWTGFYGGKGLSRIGCL
jgi:hypothetical protein